MRTLVRSPIRTVVCAASLALAAAPLTGCCAIAREMCSIAPPKTPVQARRDTPLGAVDFLIDAFNRRAPGEIFETLHPDFVEAEGGFSASQFATGYERYEPEFRADGLRLRAATKDRPKWKDGLAWVYVHDEGSSVWLVFRNQPGSRVLLDDDVSEEIRGGLSSMAETVAVEGDGLVLRRPLPLQGQADFVDPARIRRVEIYQDWLLYKVVQPRNIRFVDRIVQEMKGAR